MATCKECLHHDACIGILKASFARIQEKEIEQVSTRKNNCEIFKTAADVVSKRDYEDLLHKYELSVAEREANVKGFSEMLHRQRIDLAKEIFKEISKISVPSILPTVKMDWEAFIKLRTRYTMEEL